MNTLNIYLRSSGSTALVDIDFRIFQNSYRNKLINIYVPREILISNQQGTFMNAVKIGAILTAPSGTQVNTTGYYADYVQDITKNNVLYAMYQLTMPSGFTVYAGTQTLVVNVVNIDVNNYVVADVTNTTIGTYYVLDNGSYEQVTLPQDYQSDVTYYKQVPVTVEITTSQTCQIIVHESAYLGEDEVVDPTELELVNARLNTVEEDIDSLQEELDVAEINIQNNTDAITQNTADIEDIKSTFSQGENYIGTVTREEAPIVDGQVPALIKLYLNFYVEDQLGRAPKVGDTVIYIYQSADTDKNYKIIYGTTWSGYEIPPMELAGNGTSGLVAGTYNVGDTNNTLVDIVGGKIKNIYIKKGSAYVNIYTWLNDLDNRETETRTLVTNLSTGLDNGTVIVKKAYQDGNGNNIVDTYMTQNAGATKTFVKDYALPKVFNDIYYITADGYTTEVSDLLTPQFSVTTATIGETQVFALNRTTTAQYELSSKNSYQNKIYLTASRNCDIILKLETKAVISGVTTVLRTELSNTISLSADEIQQIIFGSPFLDLGDNVLSIVEGNTITQTLTIITEHSQETTFEIYSNETYPSTFALETTSITQIVSQGELGEQRVYNGIGTLDTGVITFELSVNSVINLNTEAEFKLSYVGTPLNSDEMVLNLGNESYRLVTQYNALSGNVTVEQMQGVTQYEQSGTYYWIFKGFIELQGADTVVRVSGAYKEQIADNSHTGVVKGSADNLKVKVNNDGTMEVNGLGTALADKQDLTASGSSDPTSSTVGALNQFYRNTSTNKVFICTAVTAQGTNPETYVYSWEEVNTVETDYETYTISSWSALSSSEPFTFSATVTATHTISNDTVIELINDNAVLFANYGFAIGSVSGQVVTIYAISEPSSDVSLTIGYRG